MATDKDHRDAARRIEVGTSVAAGTVGTALGGSKLRDAYKKEHPKAFAHGEQRVARLTNTKIARFVAHSEPGFKPLAAGAGTALIATGASKYRQKKDHQIARQHLHQLAAVGVAKADVTGRAAHVKGIGRVRVEYYHGNGHFMVIDRSDSRRLVHRSKMTFLKSAVKKNLDQDQEHALDRVSALDSRARKVKAKIVPAKPVIARKIQSAAANIQDDIRQDLQKAHATLLARAS